MEGTVTQQPQTPKKKTRVWLLALLLAIGWAAAIYNGMNPVRSPFTDVIVTDIPSVLPGTTGDSETITWALPASIEYIGEHIVSEDEIVRSLESEYIAFDWKKIISVDSTHEDAMVNPCEYKHINTGWTWSLIIFSARMAEVCQLPDEVLLFVEYISSNTGDIQTDLKKKADLATIAHAMTFYYAEKKAYPSLGARQHAHYLSPSIATLLPNIPFDSTDIIWSWFNRQSVTWYIYSSLSSEEKDSAWYIIMAKTATHEISNWIDADPALSQVSDISKADVTKVQSLVCTSITVADDTEDSLTKCTAKRGSDKLRYVIVK